MTYKELNQLYYIRREIERDERKIEEYRLRACSSTTALSPNTQGAHAGVSDKVGAYAAAIADLEAQTRYNMERLVAAEREITAYIHGIEDSRTRLAFKLRFIDCKPWFRIAMEMGAYGGESSVRMLVNRYLRDNLDPEEKEKAPD